MNKCVERDFYAEKKAAEIAKLKIENDENVIKSKKISEPKADKISELELEIGNLKEFVFFMKENVTLRELYLGENNLGENFAEENLKILVNGIKGNKGVQKLYLRGNGFFEYDQGFFDLTENSCALWELDVEFNDEYMGFSDLD